MGTLRTLGDFNAVLGANEEDGLPHSTSFFYPSRCLINAILYMYQHLVLDLRGPMVGGVVVISNFAWIDPCVNLYGMIFGRYHVGWLLIRIPSYLQLQVVVCFWSNTIPIHVAQS